MSNLSAMSRLRTYLSDARHVYSGSHQLRRRAAQDDLTRIADALRNLQEENARLRGFEIAFKAENADRDEAQRVFGDRHLGKTYLRGALDEIDRLASKCALLVADKWETRKVRDNQEDEIERLQAHNRNLSAGLMAASELRKRLTTERDNYAALLREVRILDQDMQPAKWADLMLDIDAALAESGGEG